MKRYVLYTLIAFCSAMNVASASTDLVAEVQKLYKSFQYEKAITRLQKALQSPKSLPPQVRVQANLYLSMCQFQRGKPLQSLPPMRAAWALSSHPQVPKLASKAYKAWYQKAHKSWRAKVQARRVTPPRPRPKARQIPRSKARPRVRLTKRPRVTRPPPRIPKAPPPGIWSRHKTSIIIMGIGIATIAAGFGVGAAYTGDQATLQTLNDAKPPSSGKVILDAHQKAYTTGLTATILLSVGGAITGVGVGVLIYELTRTSK